MWLEQKAKDFASTISGTVEKCDPSTSISALPISRTAGILYALGKRGLPCLPPLPLGSRTRRLRPESSTVPRGGAGRRDLRAAAAATRTGPVEAARAAASRGNDAQQAALPGPQQPRPHGQQSRGRSHASHRTTHGARKGKVWQSPLGLNFPARRAGHRRLPSGGPRAQLRPPPLRTVHLLRLLPQRRGLRGGHLALPDFSAALAADP